MNHPPPNQAPTLSIITNRVSSVGIPLSITNAASDLDVPAQALAFSLLDAPAGAAITTNTGVLTWRPAVAQANTTNLVTVKVTDNGTPSLSATQSFYVVVNPLTAAGITGLLATNGAFGFQVGGDFGPDYSVEASSNLVDWSTVFTTNSPQVPFIWSDGISNQQATRFFRVVLGP